jgi:CubicO group peptidase (beta-lactamase class C family)
LVCLVTECGSEADLKKEIAAAQEANERIRWLAASTSPSPSAPAPVFHAVLEQDHLFRPWSVIPSTSDAGLGALFDAMSAGWTRPECFTMVKPGTYWTVWRDDVWAEASSDPKVGKSFIATAMSVSELEGMIENLIPNGAYPIRISASGAQTLGDPPRFAALFMSNAVTKSAFPTEAKVSRKWRSQTVLPLFSADPFKPLDTYIKSLMVHYSIRGGQVAIVRNGELKTVRAYTYAEADYPDSTIQQTVRVGSISKPITGTAVSRLDETLPYNLEQMEVQAALGSTQLLASTPKPANGYLNGTARTPLLVKHLLTHTGGWQTSSPGRAVDWETDTSKTYEALKNLPTNQLAAQYQGLSHYPLHPALVEATVAGLPDCIVKQPGTAVAYSGYAVFLLANLLVRISNPSVAYSAKSYSDVITQLLWKPLQVQGAHLPVPENQDPGNQSEMRMHPAFPSAGPDMNFDYSKGPKRWLFSPHNFNASLTGPPGGWHLKAVDLAKLLACFDPHFTNRVLSQGAVQKFYTPSIAIDGAASNLWFNSTGTIGTTTYKVIEHNGGVPGACSYCCYCSDGIAIVVLFNLDIPASPGPAGTKVRLTFSGAGAVGSDIREILDAIPAGDWPDGNAFDLGPF